MLTVFDGANGYPISNDDYYVRELASGYNEVIFNVSIRDNIYQYIKEEAVIRDRDQNEYLIKQIDAGEKSAKVVAQINLDAWKSVLYMKYSNESNTVSGTVQGILPQGWGLIDLSGVTKRRTVPTSDTSGDYNVTALEILEACTTIYGVRFKFNTKTKIITIINPDSYTSRGAFATRDLNLVKLNYKGKSDSFATRLYAEGADGLTFASINDGKAYVENKTYANKTICCFWKDDRYTDKQSLLEDAQAKVDAMAVPTQSYDCDVLDLANTNPDIYGFEDFSLFEIITLIDDAKNVRTDYQVVERWTYPYYPAKNKVVLSTATPNIQSAIVSVINSINSSTSAFQQMLQTAIINATDLITGNSGGYLVLHDSNGDGTPDELLIMNTQSIETATKVWRWNSSGLGYSENGYNGPYGTAITMNGEIVANYITAGELNGEILKVGTIIDTQGKNYWDLETGEFSLSASTEIGGKTVDDYAEDAADNVLNDWITNTYSVDKQNIETQIDKKAETWYQGTDPATSWTTTADKAEHVGDLWYNTNNNTTWYYDFSNNTYSWKQQDVPDEVFDEIDGKARIFITQPVPPYDVADLWCTGANGGILSCITAKALGETFSSADWAPKNNYIDSAEVASQINTYDTSLNQLAVFNKLTNNGAAQGIYLQNNQLYINGTYIQAQSINANALSAGALQELNQLHSYLAYDVLTNADRWVKLGEAGRYTVTATTISVSGETKNAIAADVTNLSTYSASMYTETDFIGSPTVDWKFKIQFSANITTTADSWVSLGYYDKNGSYRTQIITKILAGTYDANIEYSYSGTIDFDALSRDIDYFRYQPRLDFTLTRFSGVIFYLYDFEITGTEADYKKSSLSYTVDGLNSVVQAGSIISTINQSAESVSIEASKINLTGDVSLRGDFKSYDPNDNTTFAFLNSGNLLFTLATDVIFGICSNYNGLSGIIFGDPDDYATSDYTVINQNIVRSPAFWGYIDGTTGSPTGDTTFENEGHAIFHTGITIMDDAPVTNQYANAIYNTTQFYGNVKNSSGGVVFVSDKRKKRNIKDLVIDKAKSFIMALKPREFKFTKDISTSDRKHHGFIAQEVKEAMHEDWGLYCEDTKDDFIGIRYDELLADMVAVIQDQEKRIDALERRLDDLTNNKS